MFYGMEVRLWTRLWRWLQRTIDEPFLQLNHQVHCDRVKIMINHRFKKTILNETQLILLPITY